MADDGQVCCILGVCCDAALSRDALVTQLTKVGSDHEYAEKCADYLLATFDLAPHGSLVAFKAYMRTHAKPHGHESV